jgi:Fe-S-cluster containining protein
MSEFDCLKCGACCAYSAIWPIFTLEDDAELSLIPDGFVDVERSKMRCNGDRCSALSGEVGVSTSCEVYEHRPAVCRECTPGDSACALARKRFGLGEAPNRLRSVHIR